MVKRGLGRGLGSLIPNLGADEPDMVNGPGIAEILIKDIRPSEDQPRQRFDQGTLNELVASIHKHGIVQPIIVRPKDKGYELVAGERRWRAAREAGMTTIPAVIKNSNDSESFQIALIENIQREDLNPLEEATAYKKLIDEFDFTQAEMAEIVGKNRATVANSLRLLNLAKQVQDLISEEKLSSGHARALLALEKESDQNRLARRLVSEGLSVRQTEELVRLWQLEKNKAGIEKPKISAETRSMARRIARAIGAKVRTKWTRDKLKLEIEFQDPDELRQLDEIISGWKENQARNL